jgi:hypothetical protein
MLLAFAISALVWLLEFWLCGFSVGNHLIFAVVSLSLAVLGTLSGLGAWLRRSLLADVIGDQLFHVRFSDRSKALLGAICHDSSQNSYVFGCEPHGSHLTHMIFGFAAHGLRMPGNLGARIYVVACWIYLFLPFINVIYEWFGVLPNVKCAMENALRHGYSLALCPSGVEGKWHSTEPRDASDHTLVRVLERPDEKLGWLTLAAKYTAFIVPVVSINEHRAYTISGWRLALGRWFIFPLVDDMEMRVGDPISTAAYDYTSSASMIKLKQAYYAAVCALGDEERKIVLVDWSTFVNKR